MTRATRDRAPSHARVYSRWLELPTWQALSPEARALLVEILARYRPGENGRLAWPVRRAGEVLGVSKSTAARALTELERNGWLAVARNAAFGGRARPALYALAMFVDDTSGQPPSNAFEAVPGERLRASRRANTPPVSHGRDKPVPPVGLHGFAGGTRQSHQRDTPAPEHIATPVSEGLRNSRIFKQISGSKRP